MPNLCSFVCDRHTEMGLVIDMKQWMIDDHLCGFSSLLRRTKHSTYRVKCIFSTFFAFSHDEKEDGDDSCLIIVMLSKSSWFEKKIGNYRCHGLLPSACHLEN